MLPFTEPSLLPWLVPVHGDVDFSRFIAVMGSQASSPSLERQPGPGGILHCLELFPDLKTEGIILWG